MRVKVVIMCHNDGLNTDHLASWMSHDFDVTIFDSGSSPDKAPKNSRTIRLPNLYWTGCWQQAIRHYSTYDVLWVVCGDVELPLAAVEYRNAIETTPPFGCWAPSIFGNHLELMSRQKAAGRLLATRRLEGMCMAMSKAAMVELGKMPEGNKFGWGMDTYMCWKAHSAGLQNLLDGRVWAYHPHGCGYGAEKARKEMNGSMKKLLGPTWRDMTSHNSDAFDNIIVGEV